MNGIDLDQAVAQKLEKNEHRIYRLDSRGIPIRTTAS